jgi:hypothetical protein
MKTPFAVTAYVITAFGTIEDRLLSVKKREGRNTM